MMSLTFLAAISFVQVQPLDHAELQQQLRQQVHSSLAQLQQDNAKEIKQSIAQGLAVKAVASSAEHIAVRKGESTGRIMSFAPND